MANIYANTNKTQRNKDLILLRREIRNLKKMDIQNHIWRENTTLRNSKYRRSPFYTGSYWKKRYLEWRCICLWPPYITFKEIIRKKINDTLEDIGIGKESFNLRSFSQLDKTQRFELFVNPNEDIQQILDNLCGTLEDWRIREHIPIERRSLNQSWEERRNMMEDFQYLHGMQIL